MINQFPAGKLWDELDKVVTERDEAVERVSELEDEIERLREELKGLMEFHPEDELGETAEEYWTPEYKAAMDAARNALKGNAA